MVLRAMKIRNSTSSKEYFIRPSTSTNPQEEISNTSHGVILKKSIIALLGAQSQGLTTNLSSNTSMISPRKPKCWPSLHSMVSNHNVLKGKA